jgi:arylsulfatase A-like enzyme
MVQEHEKSGPKIQSDMRLLLISVCVVFLSACAETRDPNVLIITVDTLRADYLGAYGDEHTRTPRIDQLAQSGTLFENAVAPMPLTRPSHFSLMTSRYPREHGVLNNRIPLPDSALTLAEIFSSNGYQTGAFVSVVLLDRKSGAGQGFDVFRHPTRPRERRASETVGEALRWAAELDPGKPFFLWVHLFEPHLPYAPEAEASPSFDQELFARFPSISWRELYQVAGENEGDVPGSLLEHAKALYRGEIENVDHWIGELLDGLEGYGLRSNTIRVLTADHGEPFENGVYFEHADSLYDGSIRIPLILDFPPLFPAGKRIESQVSILDIAPSLLAAADIPIPSDYSGLALQDAEERSGRYVLIQHPFYQDEVARTRPLRHARIKSVAGKPFDAIPTRLERVGIVGSDWKLIRAGSGAAEVYARARPHGEDERVIAKEPSTLQRLESELSRQLEGRPLKLIAPARINDELMENLKALGYVE